MDKLLTGYKRKSSNNEESNVGTSSRNEEGRNPKTRKNASEIDVRKVGTFWVELGTDRFGHSLLCNISTEDDIHELIDMVSQSNEDDIHELIDMVSQSTEDDIHELIDMVSQSTEDDIRELIDMVSQSTEDDIHELIDMISQSTEDDIHELIEMTEDKEKVTLFEFQVKLKEYTYNPFNNVTGLYFKPWLWYTTKSQHGKTLLTLSFHYDVLSMNILTIGVKKTDLYLSDSPFGCFGNLMTSSQVNAVRGILLNRKTTDKGSSSDEFACNQVIEDHSRSADFVYNCCHRDPTTNKAVCSTQGDNFWINILYLAITSLKVVALIGWTLAAGSALTLVYVSYDNFKDNGLAKAKWGQASITSYETLKSPAWACCVAWVVFACFSNCGGFVDSFLSWQAWIPLSKLTFGAYLFHMMIMHFLNNNARILNYFSIIYVFERFICIFALSYGMSLIFSLLIETPVRNLIKPSANHKKEQQNHTDSKGQEVTPATLENEQRSAKIQTKWTDHHQQFMADDHTVLVVYPEGKDEKSHRNGHHPLQAAYQNSGFVSDNVDITDDSVHRHMQTGQRL
ncbi:hypothetical protein Btru_066390 [Bulinus truncatus]|nr:hypothetical protein Btru_066390 [Bulinus truncatus]